ncbi:hypothetical protein WN55_05743 [Dufourea novaeangliae]|uniref:Uncharacterized protein n=1 Tax=Dufourea novaeangliae TaxID=178035 RepID=A0A154PPP3_DUFNO|nr:hypothetical protein WN55_05743 [Dufourea novaeangliae]
MNDTSSSSSSHSTVSEDTAQSNSENNMRVYQNVKLNLQDILNHLKKSDINFRALEEKMIMTAKLVNTILQESSSVKLSNTTLQESSSDKEVSSE